MLVSKALIVTDDVHLPLHNIASLFPQLSFVIGGFCFQAWWDKTFTGHKIQEEARDPGADQQTSE